MTDDELRTVAQEAGLGQRSINKLVAANKRRRGEDPTQPKPARGHGAPREPMTPPAAF